MILGYPLEVHAAMDLFAGSGALGLEALSRGAGFVTFVDWNPSCLEVIRENLGRCGFQERASVQRGAIPRDYPRIRRVVPVQYDLVLLDPPYRSGNVAELLRGLHRFSLLKENARIVLEHSAKEPNLCFPAQFLVADRRTYGTTTITFFLYRKGEAPEDERGRTD